MDYKKIFDELQKNLQNFDFGENGKGIFSGFNLDEKGNFSNIDLSNFAKRISDILGYDISTDNKSLTKEDDENKTVSSTNVCSETTCNCKKADTYATCAYKVDTSKQNTFTVEALIPGETMDNFRISVNNKTMKLKIERKGSCENLPWYAAFKDMVEIDLPENIQFDSFKKKSADGLLVVTAKIAVPENCEKEI